MNIRMITKQNLSRVMRGVLAACLALSVGAAVAKPSVKINEVKIADARLGTVEYTYTVSDIVEGRIDKLFVTISADDGKKSVVLTNKNVTAGSKTETVNVKTLFGKAYPDVSFFAKLWTLPAGQLWEGGPIFAECNIGAASPEKAGHSFWWGDTVGYNKDRYYNGGVSAVDGATTIEFSDSDPTAGQTYKKDFNTLISEGWIGEDGNLVAAHDAATAHLGAPWRMPTKAELDKLADPAYCQHRFVEMYDDTTYYFGWFVKGKAGTDYENNEVFFPLNDYGAETDHHYWSSTMDGESWAWSLELYRSKFLTFVYSKYEGYYVRPVRDSDE